MLQSCLTCGREALPITLNKNNGICEKCFNDKRKIENLSSDIECAIYSNNYDVVYKLISFNASILESIIKNSWCPIHYAAYHDKHNSLRAILDSGENIERNDIAEYNHTPLYISVEGNNLNCVKLLLERGANPNISEDYYLTTPLHLAARFGFVEVANILIKYLANANALDHEGNDPLNVAIENTKPKIIELFMLLKTAQQGDAPETGSSE